MDKFLTKENIVIAVVIFAMIAQSNYFATKLDISEVKLELREYTEQQSALVENKLEKKLEVINNKLDAVLSMNK